VLPIDENNKMRADKLMEEFALLIEQPERTSATQKHQSWISDKTWNLEAD
jgi:hypothetical protein